MGCRFNYTKLVEPELYLWEILSQSRRYLAQQDLNTAAQQSLHRRGAFNHQTD